MPKTFNNNELTELPFVISAPRFTTYLKAAHGDLTAALTLYRWNLQVSAAFFVPLQVCEVALRNGVTDAVTTIYSANWPWAAGFQRSLPHKGRHNPHDELVRIAQKHARPGQVVANLTLSFWQKMLTARHQTRIWDTEIFKVFPGVPLVKTVKSAIQEMHDDVEEIRSLRNRIAHHEPIFTRDLSNDYALMRKIISYRSPAAATWVDRIQTITSLIAEKP